jgi:hypothetical protein
MMVLRRRVVILQMERLPILTVTHGFAILLYLRLLWTITGTLSATATRRCIAMDLLRVAIKVGRWDSSSIISTTLF